jgi:hypothetical protein
MFGCGVIRLTTDRDSICGLSLGSVLGGVSTLTNNSCANDVFFVVSSEFRACRLGIAFARQLFGLKNCLVSLHEEV